MELRVMVMKDFSIFPWPTEPVVLYQDTPFFGRRKFSHFCVRYLQLILSLIDKVVSLFLQEVSTAPLFTLLQWISYSVSYEFRTNHSLFAAHSVDRFIFVMAYLKHVRKVQDMSSSLTGNFLFWGDRAVTIVAGGNRNGVRSSNLDETVCI